ncbi:hypothetical protein CDCA_CDCA17G4418 [Cyanidium caldarium]|uniref:Uncharacterized protein n=1 Tax=Cyanidium caldarium TaxID=2771 RepID=A0AAV9J1C4_CYACA|nr:hypothetical protein CDCA_CDCA17G4418 [Cyanidium caldarium]
MILLAAFVERQQAVGRERALESLRQSVWALVNTSARPCGGDFYAFACGNYREAVPPGESVWERGMSQVRYSAVPLLRALLENELREYRAGLFYRSCVDADALRPDDRQPLDALIAAVQRAASWEALARVLAAVHRSGYGSVIYSFAVVRNVWRSDDSATAYVLAFQQGGLGLAPSYWVGCGGIANDNDNSTCGRVLQDYRTYVQQLSRSAWPYGNHGGGGDDDDDDDHIDADAVAAAVLTLEEQLAHLYWESALPYASRADVEAATAHDTQAVPLAQLDSRYPHLHLGAYTEQLLGGYNAQRLLSWVAVRAPTLFAGLDALVATTDLQHWKWYVLYQVVSSSAGMGALGAAFTDLHFAFYGRQLAGESTPPDRRAMCVALAGEKVGDELGAAYGNKYLPERARATAEQVVRAVAAAYQTAIENDQWPWLHPGAEAGDGVDRTTSDGALAKLAQLRLQVGYPQVWDMAPEGLGGAGADFGAGRSVRPTAFLSNWMVLSQQNAQRALANIGATRFDRDAWPISPVTPQVYYSAVANTLTVPAMLLRPPLFEDRAPAVAQYAQMGSLAGHEIAHAFDRQGRMYTANGSLLEWMTGAAESRYAIAERCAGGTELWAEGVGLSAAYRAVLQQHPQLTAEERRLFFLAYAQMYCTRYAQPESHAAQVQNDWRPAGDVRVRMAMAQLQHVWMPLFQCAAAGDVSASAPDCQLALETGGNAPPPLTFARA